MPIGSSLAISKRFPGWHVIIQVVASVAAGIGYLLGDAAHHESKRLKATEAAAGAAGTSEDPPHNHNILLLEKRHASGGKRVIGLKSHETLAQIILFLISVQVAAGLAVKLCKIYWVRWGKRFSKTRLVSMCRICHQYLGRM